MNSMAAAFESALLLIAHPTPELLGIVMRTFMVSGGALMMAVAMGLPAGAIIGLGRFPLRGAAISALNSLMGLPPVVVGLFIYLMLSRSGPLGFMGLLYTPWAMMLAQFVLAAPIVAALTSAAIEGVPPQVRLAARTLGATHWQVTLKVIHEARYGIFSAVVAALGRAMAEVGAILMVGGNIAGYTRVMTTTIAMETDKGDFILALALGIILLGISLLINAGLYRLQRRGRPGHAA